MKRTILTTILYTLLAATSVFADPLEIGSLTASPDNFRLELDNVDGNKTVVVYFHRSTHAYNPVIEVEDGPNQSWTSYEFSFYPNRIDIDDLSISGGRRFTLDGDITRSTLGSLEQQPELMARAKYELISRQPNGFSRLVELSGVRVLIKEGNGAHLPTCPERCPSTIPTIGTITLPGHEISIIRRFTEFPIDSGKKAEDDLIVLISDPSIEP